MKLLDAVGFFMTQDWKFETRNVRSLWQKLSEADKELLPFDIKAFIWKEMIEVHADGIKKFILKDPKSLKGSKKSRSRVKM